MAKARSARTSNLTVTEAAWVAGIVEGEGSILIRPTGERKVAVNVKVAMCDYDVIERLAEWSGVGNVTGPFMPKGGTKPQWRWTVSARSECVSLLGQIEPFLLARRGAAAREALAAIRMHEEFTQRFCKNGHDKDECGVNAQGACKECRKQTNLKQRASA
jgi:hypothetical protein